MSGIIGTTGTRSSVIGKYSGQTLGLIGMIAPFAMVAAPTGWIICNGAPVSRTVTYVVLFGVIGTTWGVGDGASTFNLPDLEGAFLRGTGSHSETMANTSVFAGPSVGAFEDDQFQDFQIGGDVSGMRYGLVHGVGTDNAGGAPTASSWARADWNIYWQGYAARLTAVNDGTHGTPRKDDETRPFNAGVNYFS